MIRPEDVTIIIPHLGKTREETYALEECIKSLNETVPEIKKVVATNGFDDATDYNMGDVHIRAQGQCKAVNAAVATTNTPWIFVTNDDMIYAPGWWERLQTGFEGSRIVKFDDENNFCISPQLIEPRQGAPTFHVEFFGGAGGDFNKQGFLDFAKKYSEIWPTTWRTGFNLPFLIKRELWDTIGGYDISYDPWGSNSDSDLEYKIKLAGVQPYQNTNCIVYHFSQTSGTFNPENNSYWQNNFAYFEKKWGFSRTDDGIWEATFEIPSREDGRIFRPDWEGKYARH